MARRIQVLVADDSAALREAVCALLREEPDIHVAGRARNGREAVELAKSLRPDVITMDIQMPELGGLEAIGEIMAAAPARILVVSSLGGAEVDLSLRAIAAGALEVIAKPEGGGEQELRAWGRMLAESIRLMSEIPVVSRRRSARRVIPVSRPGPMSVAAIALAASTGGPPALAEIVRALPAGFPATILIAQHISAGFTKGLVRWLSGVSKVPVQEARSGEKCLPGRVYLPPDGCNLALGRDRSVETPRCGGGSCPSADLLLSSVAKAYGRRSAGVVLTGMGEDGARGLLAIRQAGGATLAQDETSSVVFGMPKAAVRLGATMTMLALADIGPHLVNLSPQGLSHGEAP